ncbi:Putative uncharacterized protein [Lactobacillus delbrueckii subsp. lactis]|nr:Putative uncharacterized protein [Lactobacillus delbrueckii subsp. lactis]
MNFLKLVQIVFTIDFTEDSLVLIDATIYNNRIYFGFLRKLLVHRIHYQPSGLISNSQFFTYDAIPRIWNFIRRQISILYTAIMP